MEESPYDCGESVQMCSLASGFVAGPPDPQALARAIAPTCGVGSVVELHRLSGGASRETWSFDLADANGDRRELVLRRDPGEYGGESDRSTEYLLLEAAAAAGVAVPCVRVLLRT